jgi:hypothetical protein
VRITRANIAIIPLGTDGHIAVHCSMRPGPTGRTNFLFDVFGYFERAIPGFPSYFPVQK